MKVVWCLSLCLFAMQALAVSPSPDINWTMLGDAPASGSSSISAMVRHGSDVYIGANFQQVGSVAASNVARWDGAQWHALGSGTDPNITAMAVDTTGNLYIAGEIFQAGGVPVQRLAHWNGSQWSAITTSVTGSVSALASGASGHLYMGGSFTAVDGSAANNVAVWDGSQWSPLGNGLNDDVTAMAVDTQGNVYAGVCLYDYVNSEIDYFHGYVAQWNGSQWQILGNSLALGCIDSLAVDSAGNVFAGGERGNNGIQGTYLARWDGSTWTAMANTIYYTLSHLAINADDDLYAVGGFTRACAGGIPYCFNWVNHLVHWDGTGWNSLGTEINTAGPLLFDSTGNLLVGGSFQTLDGGFSALVGKWLLLDADGDGVGDEADAFPVNPGEWLDTDHDGTGNNADTDDDDDGIPDAVDPQLHWTPLSLNASYRGSAIGEVIRF